MIKAGNEIAASARSIAKVSFHVPWAAAAATPRTVPPATANPNANTPRVIVTGRVCARISATLRLRYFVESRKSPRTRSPK